MRYILAILLFAQMALAQSGPPPCTNLSDTNLLNLTAVAGNVYGRYVDTVLSYSVSQCPIPVPKTESRLCYSSGPGPHTWTTCTTWQASTLEPNNTPVVNLTSGVWYLRAQTRAQATQVLTGGGLSIGDGGPDGSCEITIP